MSRSLPRPFGLQSLRRAAVAVVAVVVMGLTVSCGGAEKQTTVDATPAVASLPSPRPVGLTAVRAAKTLAVGGITTADLPGFRPLGAPLTRLDWPTVAGLCGRSAGPELPSDRQRLARRQLVWQATSTASVSEERLVYQEGGVQAALRDFEHAARVVCPSRIGVRAAPASAHLPAGSLSVWSQGSPQGGPSMQSYAVPVGDRMLVVLWSNWVATTDRPVVRTALAEACGVVVQREQPALQALGQ